MSSSIENLIISNNKEDQKKEVPLLYYFKNNVTSQDPLYPLNNLLNKFSRKGWVSNRFCMYPQEIIVEFHSYVNIKQINILINETKIPTIIEIVNCVMIPNDNNLGYGNSRISYQYKNIGFIKLSSNIETYFKARELRKIYVDILTKRIKLIIHKNYSNIMNTFCQVGIVSLDFFGYILLDNNKFKDSKNKSKKMNYSDICLDVEIEGIDESFIKKRMDKKAEERLNILLDEMEKKKEIDQLKKISYKIYNLEMYKKECVKRYDFDNAKRIKSDLDIFKKMLNDYISKKEENYENQNSENNNNIKNDITINNEEENKQNTIQKKKLTRKLNISRTQQDIFNYSGKKNDDIVLPTLQKKINSDLKSISNINSNSFDNNNTINSSGHFDSIIGICENEPKEREPLEELAPENKTKYEILHNILNEEVIRKLFSKHIYYKEEGLDALNAEAHKIIVDPKKTTQEANKHIVALINIFFGFFEEKHPNIIVKCLELFLNVIKAIKDRSTTNKTEYDFKITKAILSRIKGKLNHISKKVRLKASELYIYMLNSDFCEFNSLITELIETEVNGYYNKLEMQNNVNFSFQLNSSRGVILGNPINLSKQLMITKMKILLEVMSNKDENTKFDKKKFPQNLVGDFIIMNVNHAKEEVRDITKEVLIKYIQIFGNQILYKLKSIIDYRELMKLFQDKDELKQQLILIREEENKKSIDISNNNINYPNYIGFTKKRNHKLEPITGITNNSLIVKRNNKQKLMKSSSQPKILPSKRKALKPINNKNNISLNNSNILQNNINSNTNTIKNNDKKNINNNNKNNNNDKNSNNNNDKNNENNKINNNNIDKISNKENNINNEKNNNNEDNINNNNNNENIIHNDKNSNNGKNSNNDNNNNINNKNLKKKKKDESKNQEKS